MVLELISPYRSALTTMRDRVIHSGALQAIAALTPPGWEVRITQEQMGDPVTYSTDVDVVGITIMTEFAVRAYEIADNYRNVGAKVALGGIHASAMPEEALRHADAVVVGEAELIWKTVLEDLVANRSRGIYRAPRLAEPQELPVFRTDIFPGRSSFRLANIQASRGCPYDCEFCSANTFLGRKVRMRPVRDVVAEAERVPGPAIFFLDDNFFINPRYAAELVEGLLPLRKKWICQTSIDAAVRNRVLLERATRSGLVGMFVGLESIDRRNLEDAGAKNKNANTLAELAEKIHICNDVGVLLRASIVFGLDNDDVWSFDRTMEFLDRTRVPLASINLLTPLPGTRLRERLVREKRLLDLDWSHYTYEKAVYRPLHMSPQQLTDGVHWATSEFYRAGRIASKWWPARKHPLLYMKIALASRPLAAGYREGWERHEAERRHVSSSSEWKLAPY